MSRAIQAFEDHGREPLSWGRHHDRLGAWVTIAVRPEARHLPSPTARPLSQEGRRCGKNPILGPVSANRVDPLGFNSVKRPLGPTRSDQKGLMATG